MSPENNSRFKALIIDDESANAQIVSQSIKEAWPKSEVEIETNFHQGLAHANSFSPDVIVLDILEGDAANNKASGEVIWNEIWKNHFSPIIIHTAKEGALNPPVPANHPFIRVVTKSRNSDTQVVQGIEEYRPHIENLQQIRQDVQSALHKVLGQASILIWQLQTEPVARKELLLRTTRRRLSAFIDVENETQKLRSWEQYIYPPLEKDLMMGDVLYDSSKNNLKDPTAYYLVLTPSCDLAKRSNGRCNVNSVLVSHCESATIFLKKCNLNKDAKPEDIKKKLEIGLTQPQAGGYVLLPEYPPILPPLAAPLRNLENINPDDIGLDKRYRRTVSIDSPFREQIAWAYLQIAARPGLPIRDLDKWIEELTPVVKEIS